MPIRETYWNIPEWAITLLYVTNFLGVAILAARLYLRSRMWMQGEAAGGGPAEIKFDRLPERFKRVWDFALRQIGVARDSYAGIFHQATFLAFIALLIGTTLVFIETDFTRPLFDWRFLQGNFYLIFELVLDFFTVVGIFGLSLALLRRITPRPNKLTYSFGFAAMLWILLIDLLSGLGIETLRLAAVDPAWGMWSFAGFGLSRVLMSFDPSIEFLRNAHLAMWLFHISITATIYATFLDLPWKHIIYSPLNIFFSSFKEPGALALMDLEDETIETFGVGQVTDLSPFQLMDGDACTECGRCQAACPAFMAGTPLNPKQIVLDIRAAINQYEPDLIAMAQGSTVNGERPITREIISEEALWACTTCRACVHECPVLIEHVDSIVDMRRHLVLMEGDMPDLLANAMTNAERAGDPWGNQRGTRLDWTEGLDVPLLADKKKADVLYWVGCAGAYDPESQKVSRAMLQIFEAAGVDYALLGDEERCNCEWARRAGNEYLYQEASHSNIAVFDQYEFKTIVTHCPHCFNTFKNEYPQFGGNYEVIHHSTYISGLINQGRLQIKRGLNRQITYHDSCYLGRYNEVYDDPRDALRAIEGIQLIEMKRSRDTGLCCGGGGAQVWFETHQETPVNEIRVEEALETKAPTVAAACPFCTIMLGSAVQSTNVDDQVVIEDIALIVAQAL
ncbi:MAG: (Fe-S)-binding protein [Chloroflexi bacterium]|nr:(Fe-S)-binding protein [Chloroflexota bacterium]